MTKRSRAAALGLTSVLFLLATAACGGGEESPAEAGFSIPDEDPTATIKVVSHLDLELDGMQPVVDAFEEAHPTITVDWEQVPFDQLNEVLDARISSKSGDPDVFWADMPRIPALASRGYLTDLTEQFSEFESAWDEATTEATTYDGRLYAVPIANSTQLLYYNKDLLSAAGLQPPSADPEQRITWEQLATDAAAAADAGAANGLVFGQFDRYYQLEALSSSLGGSPGATGEGNLTPDINSDEWVQAMEFYGQLFEDGTSPRGVPAEQSDPDFLAGRTAYMVQGPWLLPELQESTVNWGVAAHPKFADGEAVTATGSWALAINPFSDQKEAAAIFLKWMSVDENSGYITYRAAPELPANVAGKETYFARDVFASEEGAKAAEIIAYETANTAVNRVPTVGFVEFEEILGRAYSDIRNGADPAEALDKAQQELTAAWAKYQQ